MNTQEIKSLIEKNYKNVIVKRIELSDSNSYLTILTDFAPHHTPYITTRILNKYPEIRVVHFTGGWTEIAYTRNTLRWGGYNVK